ncbi:single-stranded-DNA-specific exonuclease RecJ [Staphylococcus lugdunensis]|uniref:Single-stranded-DNA-specific exonuclease RecJ n=1 Tax=Staphylococcus lugdunensis TaxID=28035 RepID=A0A4Q9W7L3_STALU|nr:MULTISPECIES: single-stranded-DNA-specific exonuclease RecJ [Staphylococcus]AMG60517.1 single-stranded-DNA-specific exonuclease RecJ [Staphylococcus lugdunensis]ARJ11331.1 single-stranded-DNA-specific exonuclease RecJ [Staphylococcus lugdunensis]AST60216.1 single-stranded-DNA-specific exonuclease RecJ [Staphylococcus lugdunensis]ATG68755.1 single-stranded-DNA-specific exonuclease RecJ [Staphylococcus lugdunensis]EVI51822.1 single-stranded-DNA-specific exonuclease RecJ [Staphylococcus lugdun
MIKSKYTWNHNEPTQYIDEQIAKKYKLSPIIKKVLESKHIVNEKDIEGLLNGQQQLHEPWLLSDMTKAIERINLAIDKHERILIYGDYDADGVTSTTIMVKTLQSLGAEVGWYIPNRFSEGYGPNELAFKNAYDEGVSLIITVDNGIQGHREIEMIQELGVDVIVTDHHEMGSTLPDAFAIVHPMHPEFDYPCPNLCGAGVAYKVSQALLKNNVPPYYIALASIGTIADLVSLTDENRTIVKTGLSILNDYQPIQIAALLNEANYNDPIDEETIGFIIGPRLNAVGRLEDASLAAELLMTEDAEEAAFLAEQVNHFNNERKDIVSKITEEALLLAKEEVAKGRQFLLLAKENWHEGVLGIVASRIVETYGLPTLILNIDDEQHYAKGSARSIEQVSMFEILSDHQNLISKFGGHHMAAGMTMPIENISELREGLNTWMANLAETTSFDQKKQIDVKITEDEITVNNIYDIERLKPFGIDFNKPLFELDDVNVNSLKVIGKDKNHLKMTIGNSNLATLYWNSGSLVDELELNQPINMIGQLQINEWNGNQSPQFIIQDIAINQQQILDYRSKRKQLSIDFHDEQLAILIHPQKEKLDHNYYHYGESIDEHVSRVVLRDLPLSLAHLSESMNGHQFSQIYVVLQHQHSIYFEGMPDKKTFKACFKILMSKQKVNLISDGMALSKFLGIQPNTLKFMLKVFLELGFIIDSNGIISVNQNPNKQDIEASQVYQTRKARIEVEKLMLYDDFQHLKHWIIEQMG